MILKLVNLYATILEHRIFSLNRSGGAETRTKCTLLQIWAAGTGSVVLSKEAGFLMEEKSTVKIMEVHYDNTDFSLNTRDSSGARLHFSNNRFIRAGVLVGIRKWHLIMKGSF